jgi:histidinol-phosphate phosphatase family protein
MRTSGTRSAFFFDRDGIVNERIIGGYVTDVDQFVFIDDIFPLLKHVKDFGFLTILVTNQQGVAKGLMSEADLASIHAFMQEELVHKVGSGFDDIFTATELDIFVQNGFSQNQFSQNQFSQNQFSQNQFSQNQFSQNQFSQNQFSQNQFSQNGLGSKVSFQTRRKPSPAMLLEAAAKWNIDLVQSFMLGDSRSDSEAGRAAGVQTILMGDFALNEADSVVGAVREVWSVVERRIAGHIV